MAGRQVKEKAERETENRGMEQADGKKSNSAGRQGKEVAEIETQYRGIASE
jgi:hypothetical protein